MGFPIANTIYTISAVASAIAAAASWRTAERANLAADRANEAADKANLTADTLAAIERDRRHSELRPVLEIATPSAPNTPDVLRFRFTGPDELEPLGPLTVTITIRDDRDRSNDPILGGGPTREDVAAYIWGPWRFRPGVDDADETGRVAQQRTVAVGEELCSTVEKSPAPRWYAGDQPAWDRHYGQSPVRLRIEVTAPGFQPWVILREVEPWQGRGVLFEIERGSGNLYLLRNVGTGTATGVTVADGPGVEDRPEGVTIVANDAVRMLMAGSMGAPLPTALQVSWDGHPEPISLPMPPQ